MHFQLQNLTQATFPLLPDRCIHCGWWQGHDQGWSKKEAQEWARTAEARFGRWGKLAVVDEKFLGMIQFGPAPLFSRSIACGQADKNSVLLSCGLLSGDTRDSVGKSLVLTLLAELRNDDFELVEAFCRLDEHGDDCRFFQQGFLRDCGFLPVRSLRGIGLTRLELGGLTPAKKSVRVRGQRILRRIKRPSPAPAAF